MKLTVGASHRSVVAIENERVFVVLARPADVPVIPALDEPATSDEPSAPVREACRTPAIRERSSSIAPTRSCSRSRLANTQRPAMRDAGSRVRQRGDRALRGAEIDVRRRTRSGHELRPHDAPVVHHGRARHDAGRRGVEVARPASFQVVPGEPRPHRRRRRPAACRVTTTRPSEKARCTDPRRHTDKSLPRRAARQVERLYDSLAPARVAVGSHAHGGGDEQCAPGESRRAAGNARTAPRCRPAAACPP